MKEFSIKKAEIDHEKLKNWINKEFDKIDRVETKHVNSEELIHQIENKMPENGPLSWIKELKDNPNPKVIQFKLS